MGVLAQRFPLARGVLVHAIDSVTFSLSNDSSCVYSQRGQQGACVVCDLSTHVR